MGNEDFDVYRDAMATASDLGDGDGDTDCGSDYDDETDNSVAAHGCNNDYTILSEADIRRRQEEDIAWLSTVLSCSAVSACLLLRHFHWSADEVQEAWFADEANVRRLVGLPANPSHIPELRELTCGICLETYPRDAMAAAACGHPFCGECWGGYIGASVADSGPGCLALRCPAPSCGAAVGQDMVDALAADEDKAKYSRYLVRSYVEGSRRIKWCPAPGCEFAVEFAAGGGGGGGGIYDVSCGCSHIFCWNCTEEAHRPVECGTVAKWVLKNRAESGDTDWLLAYTKPCPKCGRHIEKNQGCMHMTCRAPCGFQFCWLCLRDWRQHGGATGGSYNCNAYAAGKNGELERRRRSARASIMRYVHYYERWAANESSRRTALESRARQAGRLAALSVAMAVPESQLRFVAEAWTQIVECRRVLKWTYAYGYYLPEQERNKVKFFEYLQGEAEHALERLHHCAEAELQDSLLKEGAAAKGEREFNEFRGKLTGLTRVTRDYFENLVRAMEAGLNDVEATSAAPSYIPDDGFWSCGSCTYFNPVSISACEMCGRHVAE